MMLVFDEVCWVESFKVVRDILLCRVSAIVMLDSLLDVGVRRFS